MKKLETEKKKLEEVNYFDIFTTIKDVIII